MAQLRLKADSHPLAASPSPSRAFTLDSALRFRGQFCASLRFGVPGRTRPSARLAARLRSETPVAKEFSSSSLLFSSYFTDISVKRERERRTLIFSENNFGARGVNRPLKARCNNVARRWSNARWNGKKLDAANCLRGIVASLHVMCIIILASRAHCHAIRENDAMREYRSIRFA